MAIHQGASLIHWNYFLALEQDVEHLARFVEFSNDNFCTYSIEMAHLYLAAASEVDVITKQLCSQIENSSSPNNIEEYRDVLRPLLPELENSAVTIPRYSLELIPWSNWKNDKTPDWWRDHNKVKHNRGDNFALANLKNVLNAMAGLFIINLYYHRGNINGARIEPPPNLFTPPSNIAAVMPTIGGRMALFFKDTLS